MMHMTKMRPPTSTGASYCYPIKLWYLLLVTLTLVDAFGVSDTKAVTSTVRRRFFISVGTVASATVLPANRSVAAGKPTSKRPTAEEALEGLMDARTKLTVLLENWDKATVDCTFADVPRDLLESKNKEMLLEKASTYALFDKSVSVETCKTTNRVVRNYLGVNGNGPLVKIDDKLRGVLDLVDPDRLDDYLEESEVFSQRLSRAVSLSYAAGLDYDSVNNFAKDDRDRNENSNLEQTREAIKQAKTSLDDLLAMLPTATP